MSSNGLPDLPDESDVRKRQLLLVSIIVILVIVMLAYAYLTNPAIKISGNRSVPVEVNIATPGISGDPIQNWVLQNENQLQAFEQKRDQERSDMDVRLKDMMDRINNLNADNVQLKKAAREVEKKSAFPNIPLPPLSSLKVTNPQVLPMPQAVSGTESKVAKAGTDPGKSLMNRVMISPDISTRIVKIKFSKKGKKNKPHIRNTIPAGSFGQAVLLSGLDAPTGGLAERNPHPVLLELIDNGNLPNRYRHRVKQCRMIASGTGNISDERAYLRLERLTCVLKNGDIISEVATGTVTGEDGKNGLRGNLVTKQGQLIANAFLAGALSNIGTALSQSFTTVATTAQGSVSTLDPSKVLESGLSSGVGGTMEKIADWYFKRAEETYPIIEVSAGRIVNLFLTEDLALNSNLLSNFTPESAHE